MLSTVSFAWCPRDTIILDGHVVTVQRQVEVDTVWVDPDTIPDIPKERIGKWEFEGFVGLRASRYKSNSTMAGMNPLEIFISNPTKAVIGPDIVFESRRSWNDRFALRTGVGLSYVGWNGADFDPEQLSDSLFRFYSPNAEELYQIERFRYPDLGTETDTLSMSWDRTTMRVWTVEVPLVASYIVPVREWGKSHHFEAGVGAVGRLNIFTKSGNLMLLNENGEYERILENDIELPSFQVLGRAEVGWYYLFKRSKNTLGIRAYFQTPLQPAEIAKDRLELQGSESGIGGFFRFFLN